MANIQETISQLCPTATFEQGEELRVTVDDKQWHGLATQLKENADLGFDYLVGIIGCDWKESLGCIYYFTSTKTQEHLMVKVATTDREHPMLHSVSDLWKVALFHEREVYDFYGIVFIGHPDMRRLFLRTDWVGYPLRKDYDANPELNPVRLNQEPDEDATATYVEEADGKVKKIDGRVFADEEYVVNFGPQHPSTHGVMRLRASIDGETILKVDPMCGYIHRGIEKLCESKTYPQTLMFTDRMDYIFRHTCCRMAV